MSKIVSNKMSSVENKDKIFKLLWVMDMHTRPPENYYRVLFQDIKTNKYLLENIYPEYLSFYTMGSFYKNSERVHSLEPEGNEISLEIYSQNNNKFLPISSVLSNSEYKIKHSSDQMDFTNEIKRQYCFLYEMDDVDIIIPCSVIGPVYYFLSSLIRQKIFELKLESLYHSIDYNQEDNIYGISLRGFVFWAYAPHIIRFATSEYANKRWNAIRNSLFKESKAIEKSGANPLYAPVKIDFPVQQKLNLLVRGKTIETKKKIIGGPKNKTKILVFSILGENSNFGFKRYQVQYRKGPDLVDRIVEIPDKRLTNVMKLFKRRGPLFSGFAIRRMQQS